MLVTERLRPPSSALRFLKLKKRRGRTRGREGWIDLGREIPIKFVQLDLLDLWLAGWLVDISCYCSRREERSLGVSVSMSGERKPFFSGTFAGENWKTRRR